MIQSCAIHLVNQVIKAVAGLLQSRQAQTKTFSLGQSIVEVFKLQSAEPTGGEIQIGHACAVQL